MLTFEKISDQDLNMIAQIVDRARSISRGTNSLIDKALRSDLIMGLAAHHLFNPLRLDDLWQAPGFDLLHDVHGIYINLSRDPQSDLTGETKNCFLPRYSVRLSEEQEAEKLGQYLINILDLKPFKNGFHKGKTYTSWGAKTPVGLGLLVRKITEEKLYLEGSK